MNRMSKIKKTKLLRKARLSSFDPEHPCLILNSVTQIYNGNAMFVAGI